MNLDTERLPRGATTLPGHPVAESRTGNAAWPPLAQPTEEPYRHTLTISWVRYRRDGWPWPSAVAVAIQASRALG